MKTRYNGPHIDINSYLDKVDLNTVPTERDMEEELIKSLVKSHIVLKPLQDSDIILKGDTVVISTESALPKFNKPRVSLTIGRGLYSSEIEDCLKGKHIGDELTCTVKDLQVKVCILEAKRKFIPQATDDMVVEQGLEGVDTIEKYRPHFRKQYEDNVFGTIYGKMMEGIMKDVEIEEPYEEDLERLGKLEGDFFRDFFKKENGIILDELTPEEFKEQLGTASMDEFIKARHDWYKIKVKQCLIMLDIFNIKAEGEYDPVLDYEVLGKLTIKTLDYITTELKRRKNNGSIEG